MNMSSKMDVEAARLMLLDFMLKGQGGQGPEAAQTSTPEPIQRRAPDALVPLTHEQSQLWLHAEMAPDMPLYNESITIHRLGPYNHRALERALTEVVRRHEIWRTAFAEVDGELVQQVMPPRAMALPLIDISHLPQGERDGEAVRLATEDAKLPIPYDQAPLFRARVVKLGEQEHRLYLTLHHIIFDGVSIYRTLVPELAALVAAFEAGAEASPLAEPALQYGDYAVWQASQAASESFIAERTRQLTYWRSQLAEPLPRLEVAGDRPRAAAATHAGSMQVFELDADLIARLKQLARREGATLYMVLLAAYKAMLFRYTGDEDIIVGGVTDTRRRPELQGLIGYFLNTMALRSRPQGQTPFRDYLAEVKASVIGALGASDIPFDALVHELDIKRGKGTHPLFNTLFSIEPPVEPFPAGWDLTQMDVTVGAAKFDIYLELDERPEEHGGGMAGRFLYSTEMFDVPTISRMIGHWTRMLHGIADDPRLPLARLPMLGEEERETLVAGWNDTAQALPHSNVVSWFAETAARLPDACAIEAGDLSWSYADLAAQSDAIAAKLAGEGVCPGAIVGLSLSRSPWMVAAMLGVAKLGAAYLPLDPAFPAARLAQIVEDAAPSLILVEPATVDSLPRDAGRLLELARDWAGQNYPAPVIAPEALAYVLYTSGSTGKPKGVEISHVALANLLMAMRDAPGFAEGETLLAITTLSFDIAELELWLPLLCGGTVLLASREQAVDMVALAELIEARRPDVLQATPATWRGLLESDWQGAQTLRALCGGEALPRSLAEELAPRVGQLWNMYGPTETTIWSTVARIAPGEGPVPIGQPIANTVVRILDTDGNDRPIGAIGELHIGGIGLARGYRGRADLTAERFVEHGDGRLYRTGDLARWRSDGVLECLGRTDTEEKIRGFRIAIEEVEGALAKLPGVSAAAVRAWPDASGERALAGYVVGAGDDWGDVALWREALGALLPDYMIPSRFVTLDELPMTPNGKVDRKALPEPGVFTGRATTPPASPAEQKLADIWAAVLKVETVYREDDFFDLGGHSLLIARLLRRIEADYGIRVPMAALFRAPRLADMAELIGSGRAMDAGIFVPIRAAGTKPPILWLDGGSTLRPLAERLGEDQPFIGIYVDGIFEAAGGAPETLEQAASLVVAAFRDAKIAGPYVLGGWCTSGILAYAVAAQLRAEGEDVALLAMAHAFHPPRARTYGEARVFVSKFRFHVGQSLARPKGTRWRYFLERLEGMSDAVGLVGGEEAVLHPTLRKALDTIALAYTPPAYDGDCVLIQPEERPGLLDFVEDWRGLITGNFEGFVVPGGHRTMLEPPNVDVIAALLRPLLARIERPAAQAAG